MMIHKCKRTMCDSETVNPTFCSDHCRWLYPVEEANTALKKENENLSASIKGMASGKANLDKSYQELEGLYGRLEKENAALVKRWDSFKEKINGYLDSTQLELMTYGYGNTATRRDCICKIIDMIKEIENE